MATAEPWGQTPLTAADLADHPLSLSDFNQDATGYWRIVRGQKTYYPREWFNDAGTFTGTGTQAGDRAGQDEGFFHRGTQWNWTTGQWENPTNWANVIGLAAAGGVGAGIAAPVIAGALGGGSAVTAAGAPSVGGSVGRGRRGRPGKRETGGDGPRGIGLRGGDHAGLGAAAVCRPSRISSPAAARSRAAAPSARVSAARS